VFPVPVASMCVPLVLRGAKKLRVHTAFGVCFTVVDIGTDFVDFMVVSEASLEIRLLRHFTSWKSSSWAVDSNEVLFAAPLCPAYVFTFRTARSSFSVTVYMPQSALKRGLPSKNFATFCSVLLRTIHNNCLLKLHNQVTQLTALQTELGSQRV
jgi:hypothetical protein